MRRIELDARVLPRVRALQATGADLSRFKIALERLAFSKPLTGDRWHDHALKGKLQGLRSVIVGEMPDGETIVMLYRAFKSSVSVVRVDPHDRAYDEERGI